jgi:putative sigma-54 modulation protein
MSINITGIHFSITDPMRDHVNSRIERLAKRYPLITANITLSSSHNDFTCVVDYNGHDQDAKSTATEKDLYKAISLATERVERQLNSQKEQAKKKGNTGVKDLASMEEDAGEDVYSDDVMEHEDSFFEN